MRHLESISSGVNSLSDLSHIDYEFENYETVDKIVSKLPEELDCIPIGSQSAHFSLGDLVCDDN